MSTITNRLGLPEPFVAGAYGFKRRYLDSHDGRHSDLSVTQLINPPLIVELRRRHEEEIEEDVADLLYSIDGSAMHLVLEMAGKTLDPLRYIVEKRYYADERGWTISGQVDLVEMAPDGSVLLWDYKTVSVWEVIKGVKPEKIAQLNVLAELMRRNGIYPTRLALALKFRDWSPTEFARSTGGYPPERAHVYEVPMWEPEKAQAYLSDRVRLHQVARMMAEKEIPVCTPEERWQEADSFALMKVGRQSAVKLYKSRDEAEAAVNGTGMYVETRPSTPKRCAGGYCNVRSWCGWYQNYLKTQPAKETA